uniref:Branched-chain amino acid ABC transporter permease n=1 Tax=Archaeoglobus fulgidus TaxID=2234 RepID=A0A7J2TGY1_ARCFL
MFIDITVRILVFVLLIIPVFFDYYIKLLAASALILAIFTISWLYLERDLGWESFGHSIPFGVSAYLFAINPLLLFLSPLTTFLLFPLSVFGKSIFPFASFIFSVFFWYLAHHIVVDGRGGEEGFKVLSVNLDHVYFLSVALFIFSYLLIWKVSESNLGLKIKAVRDDEIAARAIGINPLPVKMFGFTISCSLASIAGILHAAAFGYVSPSIFSPYFSLFPFVAATIGGRKLWSCVLASYLVVGLSWFLSPYVPEFHYIIYALAIILASFTHGYARSSKNI